MTGTHKARVSMAAHGLINECRYSGMTDADWCRENDSYLLIIIDYLL